MREINNKKYRMIWDYHTHTTFSHGKGSIEDNVRVAIRKGLKGIAISDHGPGHLSYGVKRSDFPIMKQQIAELNDKYPEIEIFLSVEANIVNHGNHLDVTEDEKEIFDFVNAGYHFGITGGYMVSNWLNSHGIKVVRERNLMTKNTDMMLAALYQNEIKILTHPGDKAPIDVDAVARACEDTGTLLEINPYHGHLNEADLRICSKYDVKYAIGSDAHVPGNVGKFQGGVDLAIKAGIDMERIVNIEEVI